MRIVIEAAGSGGVATLDDAAAAGAASAGAHLRARLRLGDFDKR